MRVNSIGSGAKLVRCSSYTRCHRPSAITGWGEGPATDVDWKARMGQRQAAEWQEQDGNSERNQWRGLAPKFRVLDGPRNQENSQNRKERRGPNDAIEEGVYHVEPAFSPDPKILRLFLPAAIFIL